MKSSKPPDWNDLIVKNVKAFRRENLRLDYNLSMSSEQTSQIFAFNFTEGYYDREEALEQIFFTEEINDKLLGANRKSDEYVRNFFKRNFVSRSHSLILRDRDGDDDIVPLFGEDIG